MRTAIVLAALLAALFLARNLLAGASDGPSPTLTFHGDGSLKRSIVYVDGLPSGPAEEFYADGSPAWRGGYKDGEREGPWTFWNRSGEVDGERTGTYRAGQKLD